MGRRNVTNGTSDGRDSWLVAKYVLTALGVLAVAALGLSLLRVERGIALWSPGFWFYPMALLGYAGFRLLREGITLRDVRREQPTADEVTARDSRSPILYLRPFTEDQGGQRRLDGSSMYEQALVGLLQEYGPVVAVGCPGDALPPLGAARLYASPDRWKAEVLDYLKRAQLVVIMVGTSEGILWEVEVALRHVEPTRLMLALPRRVGRHEVYGSFRDQVGDLFPRPLPKNIGNATAVYFGPRWGPRLLAPTNPLAGLTSHRRLRATIGRHLSRVFGQQT